jgi:uncharacterized protein YegP (UPF0339 family)
VHGVPGRFELYRDLRERFRFRLVADDGSVILSSDGFEQKASALDAIVSIMKSVQEASIVDLAGAARRYEAGEEPQEPYEEASYGDAAYGYDEYAYGDEAYAAFDADSHGAGRGKRGKRKKKEKKEKTGTGRKSRDRDGRNAAKGKRKKKK